MSSAAPSASLRNLFSELEQLFQTETEARVSTSVQAAERALTEHLNQSVRRLRQAGEFSEIAAILCDAAAPFASACAVFRVDQRAVSGERLHRGAGEAIMQAGAHFQELRFAAADAAAFAGVIESREPVVALASAAEMSAGVVAVFGHQSGDKAHLFPLTMEQNTVGVLYAAGASDSAALELLAQATAAILEAQQRAAARPQIPAPVADLVRIETVAPAPASTSMDGTATDWDALSPADRNLHLRAQRFARVQVAEMRLYRQDDVKAGRAKKDLYSSLQDAIDGGREAFRETFVKATPTMVDYFHRELVRTLANDNPAWLGEKYPGPVV
jgi:hypothetical protein